MQITFHPEIFNDVFMPTYKDHSRNLILWGGAGSGKSVWAAQKWLVRFTKEHNHRIMLVRKVGRTIRNSQYQLIKDLVGMYGLQDLFRFKESEITIIGPNNNYFIPVGVDDPEKLKSIAGITGSWIEETTELSKREFLQINLRVRGITEYYKQNILTFNPIDAYHWIKEYFFDSEKPNVSKLHTTYLDNKFIDAEYKNELEALEELDKTFYKIYTLGEWATPTNLIFRNWRIGGSVGGETIYGLDFGFNNPTALVQCIFNPTELYTKELIYQTKLTNAELIDLLKIYIPNKNSYIFADAAEPQRIEEIRRAGFNILAADKSVSDGIDFLKRLTWYIDINSINGQNELKNYKYKEDRNGTITEEPVKFRDHFIDAVRYAVYSFAKKYFMFSGPKRSANSSHKERKQRSRLSSELAGY